MFSIVLFGQGDSNVEYHLYGPFGSADRAIHLGRANLYALLASSSLNAVGSRDGHRCCWQPLLILFTEAAEMIATSAVKIFRNTEAHRTEVRV